MMLITEIKFKGKPNNEFLSYVSVVFDNKLVINCMKIVKRKNGEGIMLCMPSRKLTDGTYFDVAHPINQEFRKHIEQRVLEKWESRGGPT